METNNETVQAAPVHYNPNQLVTYKVIDLDAPSEVIHYPTEKVVDIEWQLENARRTDKTLSSLRLSVSSLEDSLAGWVENDTDAADIVSEICDMFAFNPTKDIEFEATVTVTGIVSVPLAEIADFDINDVDLNVSVDSYSHEVNAEAQIDDISTL